MTVDDLCIVCNKSRDILLKRKLITADDYVDGAFAGHPGTSVMKKTIVDKLMSNIEIADVVMKEHGL